MITGGLDIPAGRRACPTSAPALSILGPAERLDFEHRRLPLRLALLIGIVLALVAFGPEIGTAAGVLIGIPVVLSSALIWLLWRYHPGILLRIQLALRVIDIILIYLVLSQLRELAGGLHFELVYVITVIAATATHGRWGVFVASGAATLAVLIDRLDLARQGALIFGPNYVFESLAFGLLFILAGSTVRSLMRTSGEVVERREAAWHNQLAARHAELEQTARQLTAANQELAAFAYSVSHDLRAPLRSIDGFSRVVLQKYRDQLDATGQDYLERVRAASQRMAQLIDDLLQLSQLTRLDIRREAVDLSVLARDILHEWQDREPNRAVDLIIEPGLTADGDPRLLRAALENLLGNAWKFTGRRERARIEFRRVWAAGRPTFEIRDNGAGFDMAYAEKLFGAFQRLHAQAEFEGTGIGLAIVQRVINRHGGRIWAEGAVDQGAVFRFTL